MNKKIFRVITEMLEVNYNKQIDVRILDLWYQEFKECTQEIYKEIVIEVIKNEKFMPSLATMQEYKKIAMLSVNVSKVSSDDAQREMEELLKEYKIPKTR